MTAGMENSATAAARCCSSIPVRWAGWQTVLIESWTEEDIARIVNTYHAWRGEEDTGEYADIPGFCKSVMLEEIQKYGHVLTPGRYVGIEPQEDDSEPFEAKMKRLVAQLHKQQAETTKLDKTIAANLKELGYGE